MDDQIRRAEFHAIYGEPALQRYAFGPVPPIHIIVKGGHVTLEGVVDSQGDRNFGQHSGECGPGRLLGNEQSAGPSGE